MTCHKHSLYLPPPSGRLFCNKKAQLSLTNPLYPFILWLWNILYRRCYWSTPNFTTITLCTTMFQSLNKLPPTDSSCTCYSCILQASPHRSPHLRSHHLSLPRPFAQTRLQSICFTNPFIQPFWFHLDCLFGSLTGRNRHWRLFFVSSFFMYIFFCFWLRMLD